MRRWVPFLLVLVFARDTLASWPPSPGADLTQPQNQPNDPSYPGDWNLFSFIPAANQNLVSAYEKMIGSGIHADEAWEHTIGDRRVLIAVIDSGVEWDEKDLVNKMYLNRGELPVPDAACGTATGADKWDVNNDGRFNVQDYTRATGTQLPTPDTVCDPRVHDVNGNGLIDAEDLIKTFSDGKDDDGNGYVDDISGWDAYYDDNDPADDTRYGHGTGEAKDSAAQGNDGMGDIGVCPECTVMSVRGGDSFMVEANRFAAGVYFAVDSGAAMIQTAEGAINTSALGREAIDYANAQGLPVVASAADEDSFHHNMPGTYNHTIYVHANVFGPSSDVTQARTFLAFNNCTNYGAQLLLSTPGKNCSSEATGKTSGAVGLMISAALQANIPPLDAAPATDKFGTRRLAPEEIKQLLIQSVDDIYDPAAANDPNLYPNLPGWDQRSGYGRTNVGRAVSMILAGTIPPIVDVTSPGWFSVLYPDQTPTVDLRGSIRYRHALYTSYDYVVEWAPGIEPTDAQFTTIASGQNQTQDKLDTSLATWDISQLHVDNGSMPEPDLDVNRYMVTVRVRVTMHGTGAAEGVKGEIRRAFHVVRDPSLVAGFPIDLGAGAESSPKIVDLDGDGKMELVQADAAGRVHVFGADGKEEMGWPQQVETFAPTQVHATSHAVVSGAWPADSRSSIVATVAVGDLAGTGKAKDVVAVSIDGQVFAWDPSGQVLPGFPVGVDPDAGKQSSPNAFIDVGAFSSPVLADLDGDGKPEIVVAGLDGQLYAWHGDATPVAGFPVKLSDGAQTARIIATPAVGDVDGDHQPEIVVSTAESYNEAGRLYVVKPDGTIAPNWPVSIPSITVLPDVGTGLPNSAALADTDGDGTLDIATSAIGLGPVMFHGDGTPLGTFDNALYGKSSNVTDSSVVSVVSNVAFGHLDNDKTSVDLVLPGAGYNLLGALTGPRGQRVNFQHVMAAWKVPHGMAEGTYEFLDGFPQRTDDHQFFMNPSIADLDADGLPEVIAGSGGYYLHAWNVHGVEPAGWPKMTGQWIIASPAVGDLDGDGKLEVAVGTREGFLYAWHTDGKTTGRIDWASFHHDDGNTGNVETPLDTGVGPGGGGGGCGCRTGSPGSGGLLVLVVGALVVGRRRTAG